MSTVAVEAERLPMPRCDEAALIDIVERAMHSVVSEWLFLRELRVGTGRQNGGPQRLDAFALNTLPQRRGHPRRCAREEEPSGRGAPFLEPSSTRGPNCSSAHQERMRYLGASSIRAGWQDICRNTDIGRVLEWGRTSKCLIIRRAPHQSGGRADAAARIRL